MSAMKHTTVTSLAELGSVHGRDATVVVKVGVATNSLTKRSGEAIRLELTRDKDNKPKVKTFRMDTALPHSLRWLATVTGDRKLVGLVAELLEGDR